MAIYRDFIYLDLDRVQSIIAQLRKGLLTELLEGKERAVSAGGGAVLKFLFGVSAEAQGTFARTVERTSVMHDYAFEEALGALRDERLILENLDSLDRDELPVPDTAFILVRGSAKLVDYELTSNFAENWPKLNRLFTEGEPASEHSEPQHISRQQRRAAQRKGVPASSVSSGGSIR